jgi:hypothetical protein
MTPDKAAALRNLRLKIAEEQEFIASLEADPNTLINPDGESAAPGLILRAQAMIERLQAVVDEHDPEGWTKLDRPWPKDAG